MACRSTNLGLATRKNVHALVACCCVAGSCAFVLAAVKLGMQASAQAADLRQAAAIECQVADGRGSVDFARNKHLGKLAGTRKFSRWVFASDGVNLHDRIGLFWEPSAGADMSLRVAIDGPVSKPARLISVTGDTVVAVAATSDQATTRAWLITINFRHETASAVATSSGAVALKAQLMALSCDFNDRRNGKTPRTAADGWQRE